MDSIFTHNGTITMENPETGNHRTIRIKTQKEDSRFAAGERIVSLLNGCDNEQDYVQFAFIKADGRVIVWKRYRGIDGPSQYERLATMISDPERFEARGVNYMFSTTCRRCNRKLTTPKSLVLGMGPKCASRL